MYWCLLSVVTVEFGKSSKTGSVELANFGGRSVFLSISVALLYVAHEACVRVSAMAGDHRGFPVLCLFLFWILTLPSISLAYRPGDIVPTSKAGQYHGVRTRAKTNPIFIWNSKSILDPLRYDVLCEISVKNRLARCHWPPLPYFCRQSGGRVHGIVLEFSPSWCSLFVLFFLSFMHRCWFLYQNLLISLVPILTRCMFHLIFVLLLLIKESFFSLLVILGFLCKNWSAI